MCLNVLKFKFKLLQQLVSPNLGHLVQFKSRDLTPKLKSHFLHEKNYFEDVDFFLFIDNTFVEDLMFEMFFNSICSFMIF